MFTPSAQYYDAIYASRGKNYPQEVQRLTALIRQHKRSPSSALLDVACGTGEHLRYLQASFQVEGLDLDPELLGLARQKVPHAVFHQADMVAFDLGRKYGAVVCLFSSIGYVKTLDRLQTAVWKMRRHTLPGGVVVVEPWFSPDEFYPGTVHATFVDQPDLKLARLNVSEVEGRLSILDFHYLVAEPAGVRYFTERHELGLFTHAEYLAAFEQSGLETVYDEAGLEGRGLYIGVAVPGES